MLAQSVTSCSSPLRFCAPELHQQPDVDSLSRRSAGGPVETVEHVLFDCPALAALRPPSLLGWSSLPLAQRRAAMNAAATVVFVREVLSRLSLLAPPTSPSLPSYSTSSTPAPFAVGELPYYSPPASSSRTATPTPSRRLTPPRAPARSTFLWRRGAFSASERDSPRPAASSVVPPLPDDRGTVAPARCHAAAAPHNPSALAPPGTSEEEATASGAERGLLAPDGYKKIVENTGGNISAFLR